MSVQDQNHYFGRLSLYTVGALYIPLSNNVYARQSNNPFQIPQSSRRRCSLCNLLAEIVGENSEDSSKAKQKIVVKFVARYGKEVHQFLADLNHAPKLYYYGPLPDIPPFPPVPEELKDVHPGLSLQDTMHMVVMELIDAEETDNLPSRFREQLEEIIVELHAKGFVFGDLRHTNILVDPQGVVKLIDFNWCGRYDVENQDWCVLPPSVQERLYQASVNAGRYATYPITISVSGGVPWPTGVGPLRPILPQHDWHMFDQLTWV